jgi:UDP-glucose 4-epimerase
VYGEPETLPIAENAPLRPTNPYGQTKLIVENILADLYASDPNWRIARLRYFNPVGNHPSGLIGEDPNDVPNNLMPYISQVAFGVHEYLSVYGNDYTTPDGTGVRDFIHVMDLASGHLNALEYLASRSVGDLLTLNLGTGSGLSVLQLIAAFERNSGLRVPYKVVNRRQGDVASCYADVSASQRILGWVASRTIDDICTDTWRWQSQNPCGFKNQSCLNIS